MSTRRTSSNSQFVNTLIAFFVVFALGIVIGFIFGFFIGQANQLTRTSVAVVTPTALLGPSADVISIPPTLTPAQKNVSSTPNTIVGSPGPTLPRALTATPKPTQIKTIVITNEQATQMAAQAAIHSSIPIDNPSVSFLKDKISIFGTVTIVSPIPGVRNISGPITVTGVPRCQNEDFHFDVSSVQSGSLSLNQADIRASVEQIINDSFSGLLDSKRVQSCVLAEGKITINYADPR